MSMKRVVLWSLMGINLAGCAGPSAFHEIRRLRSDVGLLDQRITQLERVSVQALPSTARPPEGKAGPASKPTAEPVTKPIAAPLAKGSKRDIQQALKNAGFYQGPIDGKIRPKTREAIKEFQQANGLKVDGKIGRHTWEKLAPYLNIAANSEQPAAAQPSK